MNSASVEMTAEMPLELPVWHRSAAEELVNAATHAVGCVLAVTGAFTMAGWVLATGDVVRIVACGAYLASLIAVYAMSTLSHSAKSLPWKLLFRRLDQGTIFLLIAATYTPFSITYLTSAPWWALLATIWGVALVGFVSKVFFAHGVEVVSITPYVLLGWLPALAAPALALAIPANILWWMLAGGICYTAGTLFLIYDARMRHFHAVWHVCVIAGSACHFCGVLLALSGDAA